MASKFSAHEMRLATDEIEALKAQNLKLRQEIDRLRNKQGGGCLSETDAEFVTLFGVMKAAVELIVQNAEGWDKYRMRNTAFQAVDCISKFCGQYENLRALVELADKRVDGLKTGNLEKILKIQK